MSVTAFLSGLAFLPDHALKSLLCIIVMICEDNGSVAQKRRMEGDSHLEGFLFLANLNKVCGEAAGMLMVP